jgi:hypothetical protein
MSSAIQIRVNVSAIWSYITSRQQKGNRVDSNSAMAVTSGSTPPPPEKELSLDIFFFLNCFWCFFYKFSSAAPVGAVVAY